MKRISPHLSRGPTEAANQELSAFYDRLLTILREPTFRDGQWQLVDCTPGWDGNQTHDCFVVFLWHGSDKSRFVIAVNYAAQQSQCHARLPSAGLAGRRWRLQDQLAAGDHEWSGDDLSGRGLFLDMQPWQACVFSMTDSAATN